MDFRSNYRTIVVKLPPGLSNERYAPLVHAIFSLLDVARIAEVSSVLKDREATDAELNAAFDRHGEQYPWGQ